METIKDIIEVIVVAFLIALVVRGLIVETFVVHGPSMEPTLMDGERLLVSKIAYKLANPNGAMWSYCVTLLTLQETTSSE